MPIKRPSDTPSSERWFTISNPTSRQLYDTLYRNEAGGVDHPEKPIQRDGIATYKAEMAPGSGYSRDRGGMLNSSSTSKIRSKNAPQPRDTVFSFPGGLSLDISLRTDSSGKPTNQPTNQQTKILWTTITRIAEHCSEMKKEGVENRPDYKGPINVDGKDMQLSAWIKTSAAGQQYMSLSIEEKRTQHDPPSPRESPGRLSSTGGPGGGRLYPVLDSLHENKPQAAEVLPAIRWRHGCW